MVSSQDVPHRLSVSGIWELPFGRGRRYGSNANAAVDGILGGWQFQGIYTYQTGFPVGNFGNLIFTGNVDDIALSSDERTIARWFNTDAGFNKVTAQQLGSNVRTFPMRFDSVRNDDVNNVDLSLIKNVSIGGGRMFQFRFESLNALNHPLFPGVQQPRSDRGPVRVDRHVRAAELRAPHAGDGEVRVLRREFAARVGARTGRQSSEATSRSGSVASDDLGLPSREPANPADPRTPNSGLRHLYTLWLYSSRE